MKARGVRLHAANDLRLEEFELPEITDDEILVKVVSDSICMSTYKCAILGTEHKRVHEDVAEHPAIMGHEFAGDIVKVGKNHQDQFKPGMKFTLQPALNHKGTMWSPGGKKLIYTHLSMPPTLSQKNKNCQSFSIPSGSWILTERRNYGYNGNAQKCNCGTGEQTWNRKFFTD